MSQRADITVVVQGIGMLLEAIAQTGSEYAKQRRMQTVDGATHEVDYVVTGADGRGVERIDPTSSWARCVESLQGGVPNPRRANRG